jgi:FkbM family methyltransferase
MPLPWSRTPLKVVDDFSWTNHLEFYDSNGNQVTPDNFHPPPSIDLYNEHGNKINSLTSEYPEQTLSHNFIDASSCVLELGARYGSVSIIINRKLDKKSNQVSVEPDSTVWSPLQKNIQNNGCSVHLHKGFVSKKKRGLTSHGYAATSYEDSNSTIESLSVEEIESKYNIKFDTLVADCEGFLESFFDEHPHLYDQLHTVIFEADFPNKCNYAKIRNTLKEKGFRELVYGFQNVYKK